jgi:hypothetical protein
VSRAVVLVPGTWAWRGLRTRGEWYQRGDPEQPTFCDWLGEQGIDVLSRRSPFIWSTRVNGVPWSRYRDWEAAAVSFSQYMDPAIVDTGVSVPLEHRNVIAHSHALQPILFACAYLGTTLNRLITVSSPIRRDMALAAVAARPNIRYWLHLHSDWTDRTQWFGELWDGAFRIKRRAEWSAPQGIVASANLSVRVPGVGHSGLLRRPSCWPLWQTHGWLDVLTHV